MPGRFDRTEIELFPLEAVGTFIVEAASPMLVACIHIYLLFLVTSWGSGTSTPLITGDDLVLLVERTLL